MNLCSRVGQRQGRGEVSPTPGFGSDTQGGPQTGPGGPHTGSSWGRGGWTEWGAHRGWSALTRLGGRCWVWPGAGVPPPLSRPGHGAALQGARRQGAHFSGGPEEGEKEAEPLRSSCCNCPFSVDTWRRKAVGPAQDPSLVSEKAGRRGWGVTDGRTPEGTQCCLFQKNQVSLRARVSPPLLILLHGAAGVSRLLGLSLGPPIPTLTTRPGLELAGLQGWTCDPGLAHQSSLALQT